MAFRLMHYSGLVTKTRAMSGRLLSAEQLNQLTEVSTVNEAVLFLKETAGYGEVYRGHDEALHRGQAEALIFNSLYRDFKRLYGFSEQEQREALNLQLLRYEVDILKMCLKYVYQEQQELNDAYLDDFFYRHIGFSVQELKKASSLQEFELGLKKTPYEQVFSRLTSSGQNTYGKLAQGLDVYYYTVAYRKIKNMKSDQKKILTTIYGSQIDWLNIMWIYRSKRFYQQSAADTCGSLIPFSFRLKKRELDDMVKAQDAEEFVRILAQTGYFKGKEAFVELEEEISYRKVIQRMYQKVSRENPYSMAPVLKYIADKNQEMERLTTIIEGIRYQIEPKDIKDLILITI